MRPWARADLLPAKAEEAIYASAIDALVQEGVLLRIDAQPVDVVGLNPAALLIWNTAGVDWFRRRASGADRPEDSADALLGMPCLDALQEAIRSGSEAGGWLAKRFSRGDLRRVISAEHTGLLQRDQREALELRFKAKDPSPGTKTCCRRPRHWRWVWTSVICPRCCSARCHRTRPAILQRIGRAGRRDGNALTTTLADGAARTTCTSLKIPTRCCGRGGAARHLPEGGRSAAPADVCFLSGRLGWSGIPDTALPDKTQEALDARDSLDQTVSHTHFSNTCPGT